MGYIRDENFKPRVISTGSKIKASKTEPQDGDNDIDKLPKRKPIKHKKSKQ